MHDDAEVLPLFPWEERSMTRRICAPPTTSSNESKSFSQQTFQPLQPIPSKCCIGSSSSGGQVTFKPHVCNLGLEAYLRAEQHVLGHLKNHPINNRTRSAAPTATSCDVCRIVEVLARNNWTMTFQGDSTMHQLADAFDCALRRRGYRVETDEKPWRRPQGLFWRYGIGSAMRMRVWPPSNSTPGGRLDESSLPVIIRYYGMYRPHFGDNSSEIYHVMERSDVLVFDHGLHYTIDQDKVFSSEMTKLLGTLYEKKDNTSMSATRESAMTAVKKPKVIAWKETVSQHYDTPTGDYASKARKGAPDGCVQHPYLRNDSVSQPDQFTWYQDYMMRITQEMGLEAINADSISSFPSTGTSDAMPPDSSLFVLPLTQFTRPLHYLHPGGADCTHICYTPLVWMPLWRSLRVVLDKAASDHQHQANSHVSTFVVSELSFMLKKMNTSSLVLFFCGSVLSLRLCCGKARNHARFCGNRIFLVAGIVFAIGIAAKDLGKMNNALQSITSRYNFGQ